MPASRNGWASRSPIRRCSWRCQAVDEGTVRIEGLDGVRRMFGFVRVPSSDARAGGRLRTRRRCCAASTATSRSPICSLASSACWCCMIAWFGGERLIVRPDPLARPHGDAHRPRRPRRAHREQGLGQGIRAARDRAQRHGAASSPSAKPNCAPPTAISRSSPRSTRSPASPIAAASTRGSPADWQRAGKLGRPVAPADDRRRSFQAVQRPLRPRRRRRLPAPHGQAPDGGRDTAPTTCRRATAARSSRCCMPGADVATGASRWPSGCGARSRTCASRTPPRPAGQVTISVGVASLVPGRRRGGRPRWSRRPTPGSMPPSAAAATRWWPTTP